MGKTAHLKKHQFKPGQSGNPSGGNKKPKELRRLEKLTQKELIEIGSIIVKGSIKDIEKIAKDKNESVLRHMIASVAMKAVAKGDASCMEIILNRLVGKVKDQLQIDNFDHSKEEKISFHEFCKRSGYPEPFPKQLEMREFILKTQGVKMLMGARGYGKTEYITTLGIAYEIYLDPLRSFLIMTKSEMRNKAILREISRSLETMGMEFAVKNSEDLFLKGRVGINATVSAVTLLTCSLRGRHPTDVIFDDPVTPESATPAHREKLKVIYDEVVGKVCPNVGIIGQPVHPDDLYTNLQSTDIPKMNVPFGEIPSLDADLEAQRAAGVTEESIERSYFLKHPVTGEIPFNDINYLDSFPKGNTSVAFIDPSFKGGDYTALSIVKQHFDGLAVEGFCYKKAWNHCLDEMYKEVKSHNVKRLAFETNSLGDMPLQILREALKGVGIVGICSSSNKHSRIMAAAAFSHLIHLSKKSHKIYIDQIIKYEYNAKHDDAPDSLASCLSWLGLIRGK